MLTCYTLQQCFSANCCRLVLFRKKTTSAFVVTSQRETMRKQHNLVLSVVITDYRMMDVSTTYLMDRVAKGPQEVAAQLPAKPTWRQKRRKDELMISKWHSPPTISLHTIRYPSNSDEHQYANQEVRQGNPPTEEEHIRHISTCDELTWHQYDKEDISERQVIYQT